MKLTFRIIESNFGILLLISAVIAYFFPNAFLWGGNLTDEMIMLSLFLGCLKINFAEIFHLKNNFGKMIFFVVLNIIILPLVFYLFSSGLDPDIRLGFFLLLATSGAVATPLLASILHLKILWSTVFVVATSTLIPFTLPFLIQALFGITIEISVIEMFLFLAKLVFVPALLAICVKKFFPKATRSVIRVSGFIGTINMAVFVGIVIAVNQPFISVNLFHYSTLAIVVGLLALFIMKFLLGFLIPVRDAQERWTNSLMFGNMNNGLMILLAAEFFTAKVLLVVLLSEIPWVLAQPVFQKTVQKYGKWHESEEK